MAAKPEQKATEMVKDDREDSGDWLAGIFDAADEDVITPEMSEMSLRRRLSRPWRPKGVAPRVRPDRMRRGGGKRVGASRRRIKSHDARSCEGRR